MPQKAFQALSQTKQQISKSGSDSSPRSSRARVLTFIKLHISVHIKVSIFQFHDQRSTLEVYFLAVFLLENMSGTLFAMKASSEAGSAEQKRNADRRRNILILVHAHLIEHGYAEDEKSADKIIMGMSEQWFNIIVD